MSTDQPYTPSDEAVREIYVENAYIYEHIEGEDELAPYRAQFNRWLAAHDARVRRDAARSALIEFRRTELAIIPPDADEDDPIRTRQQALAWRIEMHLLANHPKERRREHDES